MVSHRKTGTRVHGIWLGILSRCSNKNVLAWKNYGGRGIKVCERWKTFENFYADMGDPPDKFGIERINNNGDYEPGNCKWASPTDQGNNRRVNRIITVDGISKTMTQWSRETGVRVGTIWFRIMQGWEPKRAVYERVLPRNRDWIERRRKMRQEAVAARKSGGEV